MWWQSDALNMTTYFACIAGEDPCIICRELIDQRLLIFWVNLVSSSFKKGQFLVFLLIFYCSSQILGLNFFFLPHRFLTRLVLRSHCLSQYSAMEQPQSLRRTYWKLSRRTLTCAPGGSSKSWIWSDQFTRERLLTATLADQNSHGKSPKHLSSNIFHSLLSSDCKIIAQAKHSWLMYIVVMLDVCNRDCFFLHSAYLSVLMLVHS